MICLSLIAFCVQKNIVMKINISIPRISVVKKQLQFEKILSLMSQNTYYHYKLHCNFDIELRHRIPSSFSSPHQSIRNTLKPHLEYFHDTAYPDEIPLVHSQYIDQCAAKIHIQMHRCGLCNGINFYIAQYLYSGLNFGVNIHLINI